MKQALFAGLGFAAFCLSVSAEMPSSTANLHLAGDAMNGPVPHISSLALGDRDEFFFASSFGFVGRSREFLPSFNPGVIGGSSARAQRVRRGASETAVELSAPDRFYAGGEVGLLYGHSSGKYGGDYGQGYVIGEVGNDHFHITVGASHEEWSGRSPRFTR